MNQRAVVAARDVRRVLTDVHEALHDEVRVLKSARSKRAADDAVRRITKCKAVLGQALGIQNGNVSKIRDAASSSYVMKSMDVKRRRKERRAQKEKGAWPRSGRRAANRGTEGDTSDVHGAG